MADVDIGELQSSSRMCTVSIFGYNDSMLTNTLNLFLEVSKVHSKIESMDFENVDQGMADIVMERMVNIFQAQKHVDEIAWIAMAAEFSVLENFILKLNSVSNTVATLMFESQDPETTQKLQSASDDERAMVITAMNRSASIVHMDVVIFPDYVDSDEPEQSIFNEQEQEEIRRIGTRNTELGKLAKLTGSAFDASLSRGLRPRMIELAAQSGHRDHTTLVARFIQENDAGSSPTSQAT